MTIIEDEVGENTEENKKRKGKQINKKTKSKIGIWKPPKIQAHQRGTTNLLGLHQSQLRLLLLPWADYELNLHKSEKNCLPSPPHLRYCAGLLPRFSFWGCSWPEECTQLSGDWLEWVSHSGGVRVVDFRETYTLVAFCEEFFMCLYSTGIENWVVHTVHFLG
jgi:hypothetical protein